MMPTNVKLVSHCLLLKIHLKRKTRYENEIGNFKYFPILIRTVHGLAS